MWLKWIKINCDTGKIKCYNLLTGASFVIALFVINNNKFGFHQNMHYTYRLTTLRFLSPFLNLINWSFFSLFCSTNAKWFDLHRSPVSNKISDANDVGQFTLWLKAQSWCESWIVKLPICAWSKRHLRYLSRTEWKRVCFKFLLRVEKLFFIQFIQKHQNKCQYILELTTNKSQLSGITWIDLNASSSSSFEMNYIGTLWFIHQIAAEANGKILLNRNLFIPSKIYSCITTSQRVKQKAEKEIYNRFNLHAVIFQIRIQYQNISQKSRNIFHFLLTYGVAKIYAHNEFNVGMGWVWRTVCAIE